MDADFTIVDVETTGLSPSSDRIIEIAALVIEGGKWVRSYSSFVNPQRPLPPFISELTGIQAEQLEGAPPFDEIADEISELFHQRVLVAHNARFDYGFIKNELMRVGLTLKAKPLCTVRLSRQLFPRERGHGLDKVMARMDISCSERHRAFGDALVLWEFLNKIQETFPQEEIQKAWNGICKRPSIPSGISVKQVETLPEGPGVYLFYDKEGVPLYVGKSIHIKERVLSHFSSDHTRGAEMSMCRQTTQIETMTTGGELGALLMESHLIKKLSPIFNRQGRVSRRLVALRKTLSPMGYFRLELERVKSLNPSDLPSIQGIFRSMQAAKRLVQEKAADHHLCLKHLSLEKGAGRCFATQLKRCQGACVGDEEPLKYNLRFTEAFANSKIPRWPFAGPIQVKEGEDLFVLDQWCLIGKMKSDELNQVGPDIGEYIFDLDSYKIIKRYLRDKKNQLKIRSLQNQSEYLDGQIGIWEGA